MAFQIQRQLRHCLSSVLLLGLLNTASATPWFARVWQADDGLPGDNVTGVAQSQDGYLWIATQSGLARFDGIKIQNIPIPTGRANPIIRAMTLASDGKLWLALDAGTIVRFDRVNATLLGPTNGLPRSPLFDSLEATDGSIWICYLDGSVCRITGDTGTRFAEDSGLTGTGPCSLTSDAAGELWYAKGGQVGKFRQGRFNALFPVNERFLQIKAARAKGIWICAGERLLKYEEGGSLVELGRLPTDASLVRATTIFEDRSGAVWIGTSASGLFRYDGTNIVAIETSHGRIRTVTEDREGNIWVGTDGGGLNRLRQQVVELQRKEDGLPFDTVRSTGEDASGAIWVVTQNGAVARRDEGEWEIISAAPYWPGGQATCVATDTNGVVWLGTYLRGLYRWENGQFSVLRRANGLAASSIRSLLADREGNLWIAYSTGNVLQRFRDGQFKNYALPEGSRAIRAMTQDAKGNIWMANLDAQLLRVNGDTVADETPHTGEPSRPIRCLLGTADGSLWIGYSAVGVGRLQAGRFALIGTEQGLQDNSVCSLTADERGWIWFGADHGIFRVSQSDLNAAADGKSAFVKSLGHGRDDGLPSLQSYYGYSPGATRTRSGRILIPTHSGLAIVHPERVQNNRVKPPVIVETVLVDNRVVQTGQSYLELPLTPEHRKVVVNFTAPSFIEAEKVRFRYRLEGLENEWVDAGSERSAVYARLPAGKYKFHVAAGNNAGVWNEVGATVNLLVKPFYWQIWWVQLGLGLLFTAVVFAVARFFFLRRLRLQVRRLEQENALQSERARIAQDIHDDFGACMTQISLLAELAQQNLARPAQAAEHVGQIATMSRSGIRSLDEIVWAVNPRNDTLPDLLDYAGQYAVNFLQAAGIRCRVDFPETPPPRKLAADVRHGLFLAVKEALHNVVKHSQATEVWLRVRVTDAAMQWTIEDNGHGFQEAGAGAQADGLRNMRQRLAELGGACSIEAQPGAGVKIKFDVPWHDHD